MSPSAARKIESHDHMVDAMAYAMRGLTQVQSWWKYDNLWHRIIRRKTFYFYIPSENWTTGYRILRNGDMLITYSQEGRKK